MPNVDWAVVKTHFEQAADLAADEQAAYLADLDRTDPALHRAVADLLQADTDDGPLADPTGVPLLQALRSALGGEPADTDSLIGRRVGAYRIVRLAGRGGMGAVYLAERADGLYEQRVAVKVLGTGLLSESHRQRFAQERQTLAMLQHPHIARLVDGGVLEDGTPYLVMDYIDGVAITTYADEHGLSVEDRLRLFATVCEAVQAAHQQLVVHRDLKPSNVLVAEDASGRPVPTLVDFGIARLLSQPDADRLTQSKAYPMTPRYAAPEQVRGEPATTLTDVYALGLLLYRLLAGRLPYDLDDRSPASQERLICETPAPPPSARVDADGPAEPQRLRGDLDVIVLKALRKDPAQRYGTAAQLAGDVRRHLEGRPITARPATLGYRLSTFARRHRTGLVAAALVVVALAVGGGAAVYQARSAAVAEAQAAAQAEQARETARRLLFDVHDAIATLPGTVEARRLVVGQALTSLQAIADSATAGPALRLELAMAYRLIADVQGNPTNANLGQSDEARAGYEQALALARSIPEDHALADEAALEYGLARKGLADVLSDQGDLDAAMGHLVEAIDVMRRDAARHPDDPQAVTRYAIALIKLGDLQGNPNFPNRDEPAAALARYQEAREVLAPLQPPAMVHEPAQRLYALMHERIGSAHEALEQPAEAAAAYQRALELRMAFTDRYPANLEGRRDLGIAHEKVGHVHRAAGRLEDARVAYADAHRIYTSLLRMDPANANARRTVAIGLLHLGDIQGRPDHPNLGDSSAAAAHYRDALTHMETLYQDDPANERARWLRDLVQARLDGLAAAP